MLAISASTLLLISALASASPVPQPQLQRRSAAVIPFRTRAQQLTSRGGGASEPKVFNKEAALQERNRVAAKYANIDAKAAAVGKANANGKRDSKNIPRGTSGDRLGPYDVALKRRQSSGSEALTDQFDTIDEFYWGALSIGTPAQDSSVDFDTGSSDLVIPLTSCTSGCAGQLFDTSQSSTYSDSGELFSISYADQSGASGTIATDTVTVAGLTVAHQGFGAVNNETGGFGHGPNAGLLGLGFPANAESGATPFFISLCQSGSLASNLFSFYMSRNGGTGSELCIGCTNSDRFTGEDIDYFGLDPSATGGTQLYWNIPSTGLTYDNGSAGAAFGAVIDSGTTLIYVAPDVAAALYNQIPGAKAAPADVGQGFYTYPCSATLGTVSIGFGSKQYAISAADFNLGPASQGSSDCVGGIIGQSVGNGLAIVGDEFMKNVYSVFDYDNMQVGLASLASN